MKLLIPALVLTLVCAPRLDAAEQSRGLTLGIKLPEVESVELLPDAGNQRPYVVTFADGHSESLSPVSFTSLVSERMNRRSWLERVCNISSPIGFLWVALGLAGQVLFTGRLLVQWLASERQKRSVVPVAFWWMSLIGGALLLAYFTWRRDIVGFLGQLTGFTIYTRNLILIYARKRESHREAMRQPVLSQLPVTSRAG